MAIHKSLSLPFLLFFLPFLSSSHATISSATAGMPEAEALLKWKASLSPAQALHSWSLPATNASTNTVSPCKWTGISCNSLGSVTEISLPSAGLQGELDNLSFPSFPNLVHLNLSGNTFTGTIPAHIGTLYKLMSLDLSANNLSGILPLSMANLRRISELDISSNEIRGEIAPIFFTVTDLPKKHTATIVGPKRTEHNSNESNIQGPSTKKNKIEMHTATTIMKSIDSDM